MTTRARDLADLLSADGSVLSSSDRNKLDVIETGADVTDTENVNAAGALMESEVTNISQVKAFDSTDYATAAQGSLADSAIQTGDNISELENDSDYVTTSYVNTQISNLVDSSPATLDTLNELAAALGDDPNFATTVSNNIGTKANKTTTISAGSGLTGGGDLSANRTISVTDAPKWTTARTLSLSGDASGSVSWDGSANATLSVTVADDSHNHVISNVDGLQTALNAKYDASNPSGYTTYSANQSLNTNNSPTFINVYANDWFRNNQSGEGLYNQATTQHWYSDDDDWWNVAGGSSANGIRFRDEHNGTVRGAVYANNSNEVGILDSDSSWAIKHVRDSRTEFFINNSEKMQLDSSNLTVHHGSVVLGGTGRIQGVDTVSSGTDAANKNYVDNTIASAAGVSAATLMKYGAI